MIDLRRRRRLHRRDDTGATLVEFALVAPLLFVLLFGITGAYLCFPEPFGDAADKIQPMTEANAGRRVVDTVMYWLARAHFGRFGGWSTKIIWASFGLAPAVLFVTGVVMWWNRVLRPSLQTERHTRRVQPRAKRREAV